VAASLRVLNSPVRVTGGLRVAQLLTLVTADAVAQESARLGTPTDWVPSVLAGDLSGQLSVEQDLAREGLDRESLGRDEFAQRVRASEADGRAAATAALRVFDIDADLERGALDSDAAALAARVAFVRLYEAGLLVRADRVVDCCPRCATVVDAVDAEAGGASAQAVRLTLIASNHAPLELDIVATELLLGAIAITVPSDHPAAGATVDLPLAERTVPVVGDDGAGHPALVVPAHDAGSLELGARLGPLPVVLDADGTVAVDGPLRGLNRYAARAAATDLLHAEGVVTGAAEVDEPVSRCRRCGTVLVPRLGRHWFLPMADLEVLAADAVRQGVITVAPASAGDELLASIGQRGDWCLSHQVWAGQPVPVATCLDCGQLAVSVEPVASCGKCMGALVGDDDVLDARFVGAVWPLAVAGWPQDQSGPAACADTTLLVVAPSGIVLWAVRMAALGLKLAGAPPFTRVAVHSAIDPLLYIEPVTESGEAVGPLVETARANAADLAASLLAD